MSDKGRVGILVEMEAENAPAALAAARRMRTPGVALDGRFPPVPVPRLRADATLLVRCTVDERARKRQVAALPDVVAVWDDPPIEPFPTGWQVDLEGSRATARCGAPPCDCSPQFPKGTLADVAEHIGADRLWAQGVDGRGVVVGVVDSGVRKTRFEQVVDGWPDNWGAYSGARGHGNMVANAVLGVAPDCRLYDLRILGQGGGFLSGPLQAFQWAIDRYRADGTPQVLTNSWGVRSISYDYATDPEHPFTRKVEEAIGLGIIIVFSAGNCGAGCPSRPCARGSHGPGRSILGANGHKSVLTVGAVNLRGELAGYSSQGPAPLFRDKPDFCGLTHYRGYFTSDTGTSAAAPIVAGAVALLKQRRPEATVHQIRNVLKETARNVGPPGFDQHTGAGVINALDAWERLMAGGGGPPNLCKSAIYSLAATAGHAQRIPALKACLCYYVCRKGRKPGCAATYMKRVEYVKELLLRCPGRKEWFKQLLKCEH